MRTHIQRSVIAITYQKNITEYCSMIRGIDKDGLTQLGLHIKELRKKKGVSQEQLAYTADVSLSQISRIETGKHNTSFSTLLSICKAFNITLDEFFDGFDYPSIAKKKVANKKQW